jgi:ketosteroid isomerase-like protein
MNIRQFFGHASDMAAIRSLMMRYKVALDQCDLDAVLACHADVEDISAITLDSAYYGRKAVRSFFEKLFSPAVREDQSRPPSSYHLAIHGDTASLIVEHEMRLLKPEPQMLECRISFHLIREAKDWRILSSHLSAPRSTFMSVGDAAH